MCPDCGVIHDWSVPCGPRRAGFKADDQNETRPNIGDDEKTKREFQQTETRVLNAQRGAGTGRESVNRGGLRACPPSN